MLIELFYVDFGSCTDHLSKKTVNMLLSYLSICHCMLYSKYYEHVKATFSVHKLIPKNAQMTTLYTYSFVDHFHHDLLY